VSWTVVLSAALFVGLASFLRGLTGFGFAIVATPLLALVMPPSVAVPVAILLQIPSGLPMVVRDWRDTDFSAAATAWIAGVPALVPGLYLVSRAPPDVMRLAVGAAVILSTVSLALGSKINRAPKTIELLGAGALSGLMQGAVAMAGPPLIVLILASSWTPARCRATLSFFFLLLGTAALLIGVWQGVVTRECIFIAACALPGLLLGQAIGARLFLRIDARKYRTISILSVAATGILVTIKGILPYL
jgi:uncharacterized membrane protein YfcA